MAHIEENQDQEAIFDKGATAPVPVGIVITTLELLSEGNDKEDPCRVP